MKRHHESDTGTGKKFLLIGPVAINPEERDPRLIITLIVTKKKNIFRKRRKIVTF